MYVQTSIFQFPSPGFGSGADLSLTMAMLEIGFAMKAKSTKNRPSHAIGVGAVGFAHVIDNAAIPESDFFKPGRAFRVRMRHGNFQATDDAMLDGRSATLKFDDLDSGGPLDLLMNTGYINFFQNLPTFITVAQLAREEDESVIYAEVYNRPIT